MTILEGQRQADDCEFQDPLEEAPASHGLWQLCGIPGEFEPILFFWHFKIDAVQNLVCLCCAVTHLNLISTLSPTVGDHQSEGQHVCLGPWPVWHCRQCRHQRRMQTQLGPMCSDTFSILGRFRGTIWRWRKGIRAAVVTDVKINWYKLLSVLFLPAQWLDFL